jgi:serine phosphatase RsbU (regulator of sigma subunit)
MMTSLSLYEAESLQDWVSLCCKCLGVEPNALDIWCFSKYEATVFLEYHVLPETASLPLAKMMWRKLPKEFQDTFQPQTPTIEILSPDLVACLHGAQGRQVAIRYPIGHEPQAVLWFLGNEALLTALLSKLLEVRNVIEKTLSRLLYVKQQTRMMEALQKQNEALEISQQSINENVISFLKIHKQLTDSLMYAKKIQQAILPAESVLQQNFEEFFVLFQPKDIVSGDFYWFSQLDYTFLAVVDCTGHGVPGAFMSMIGNTLLNEIVNVKRQTSPAQILVLLNIGIHNALKQGESLNADGMDIGLCRLERDEMFQLKLTFASAKNTLYLYHHATQTMSTLKGNRVSLGGNTHKTIQFTETTLSLEDNDVFYLMTDGLADICNAERVSFGSVKTQTFLLQNACLPLATQKANLQALMVSYQNGTPQRDDITIIGIKP